MDSGAADEYWLAEFVGEDENWVSSFLQDIHLVDEESNDIERCPTGSEATAVAEVSPIVTSTIASTITQRRTSNQQDPQRIPFDKRWELLKPEIERLYITKNLPLRDIIGVMKEKYDFDALWVSRKAMRNSSLPKRLIAKISTSTTLKSGGAQEKTYDPQTKERSFTLLRKGQKSGS
jgi:hypothetical protein